MRVMLLAAAAAALVACASSLVEAIPAPPRVIRGVNLGNWFILEKYLGSSMFDNNGASDLQDEWHLCERLGDQCQSKFQEHWNSYVTRDDLSNIRNAGLNSVRIPIGYWAVLLRDGDKYVQGQIPVLNNVLGWCKELGLTVQIDLHGVPGSQSKDVNTGRGQDAEYWTWLDPDHSITFDVMNRLVAAVAPHLESAGGPIIAIETVNEPMRPGDGISRQYLSDYYKGAYKIIRDNTPGDNGAVGFSFHDQWDTRGWEGFMPSSDNYWNTYLDSHQYFAWMVPKITDKWEAMRQLCADKQGDMTYLSQQRWFMVGEFGLTIGADGESNPFQQDYKDFAAKFIETQMAIWENPPNNAGGAGGWYFWNFKTEGDWDNTWNYMRLYNYNKVIPWVGDSWKPTNHCGEFMASEHGQRLQALHGNTTYVQMGKPQRIPAARHAPAHAPAHPRKHLHHSLREAHNEKH